MTDQSRRPRGVVVALIALAVTALLSTAVPFATATVSGAQPSTSADSVSVSLIDQTTWVDPDGEIVVRVGLRDAPADATVEVTLHERLRSRADFLSTLDRENLRGRLTDPPIVLGTADELGTRATARIPIRSGPQDPEAAPRLGIADPGVHPVDIAVYSPERVYLGGLVTHVVRLPVVAADDETDESDLLGVVLVQSLDADPSHRPDGSVLVDQTTRELWTEAVEAWPDDHDAPRLLSVRPETVASLAISSSPRDRALLDEVRDLATDQTVATNSFVELDLDAMLSVGLDEEIARQLDLGAAELDRISAPDHRLWVGDSLSNRSLAALVGHGVDRVVVPRRVVGHPVTRDSGSDPDGGSAIRTDPPTPDTEDLDPPDPDQPLLGAVTLAANTARGNTESHVAALVSDPYLRRHQGRNGDPLLDAQNLLADLVMLSPAGPLATDDHDEDRVVALDLTPSTDRPLDPTFIATVLAGIENSPFLQILHPDDAFSVPTDQPRYHLRDDPDPVDLSSLRDDLNLARLSISSFRAIFPLSEETGSSQGANPSEETNSSDETDSSEETDSPDALGSDEGASNLDFDRLLAVVVSSRLDPPDRRAYFLAMAGSMESALDSIDVHARAITLPARDGTVPVTFTNDHNQPALVAVRVASDRLDFPLGPRLDDIELQPGTTTIEIPVRARASGAFPLDIEVESPDGRIALAASRYTVRSTAVSGVGVAISVAAVAVLAVWWIRTARRARAARATSSE